MTPNAGFYGHLADGTPSPNYFNGYYYIKRDSTDSGAAATALATGVKTYTGAINYDNFGQPLRYITQDAKALWGKATGIVSSVQFASATVAAFGAQNSSRRNLGEISKSMINNPAVDLIMGTGHPFYDHIGNLLATPRFANETGPGGGYIAQSAWNTVNDASSGWQLIEYKADFEALADGSLALTGSKLIGVPQNHSTLQLARLLSPVGADARNPTGIAYIDTVPTLEVMTRGALNFLSRDPDGFFMMVESGAVDWAAHANAHPLANGGIIEEMIDFNKSVAAAVNWVKAYSSWNESLIIVLTDHGNGMPMGPDSDTIAFQPIQNNGQGVLPGVRWHSGSHTNENTLLFAHGAGADLFYAEVDGVDPGLRDILRFNDGRYINNTDVHTVMQAAMVPVPAAIYFLGSALVPMVMVRIRRRQAA